MVQGPQPRPLDLPQRVAVAAQQVHAGDDEGEVDLRVVLEGQVDVAHLPWTLRGTDDAVAFHDVDEPAGTREADRHLPLEHRHGRLARALDDVDGLLVAVVVDVVTVVVTRLRALPVLDDGHVISRVALLLPMADDELDLAVRHEGALRPDGLRRVGGHPEHVAAAEELLRAGHVENRA